MSATPHRSVAVPLSTAEVASRLLGSRAACALLDRDGVVKAASAGLAAMIPDVVGRRSSDAFGVDASALIGGGEDRFAPTSGVYTAADGDLVPVVVQALYETEDACILVLVVDGAPFRRAEAERFKTAAFTVIRIGRDGVVRFANNAALDTFEMRQEPLLGRPLASLFLPGDAAAIEAGLAACVAGKPAEPASVTIPATAAYPAQPVRLLLMPDCAPDGRCLGAVGVVQSLSLDNARDQIRRLAFDVSIADWRQRLRLILNVVRTVVEFDHAIFGLYAEKVTFFRPVHLEPAESIEWPSRWLELPPSIAQWLDSGTTWIADIDGFLRLAPELKDKEVTRLYVDRGIRSSLTLPARGSMQPTSALSLCSASANKYGAHDLQLLLYLDLEPVMLRLEADIRAEREQFWNECKQRIASSASLGTVAQEIVDGVARHFDWDHVSLFRVNRSEQAFELVFQHARTESFQLPDGYRQSFSEGMLGAVLAQERVLILDDLRDAKQPDFDYRPVNRRCRSAMAMPLRLNGRIRWIVNAESSVTHAFRGPDRRDAENVVQLVERGLAERMLFEIKTALLNETEQGVVIAGTEGAILELNPVASRLLGKASADTARGAGMKRLADYGADELSRETLARTVGVSGRRVELRSENGAVHAALAKRQDLDAAFDTAIWFFTDLEGLDWSRDLRFLRETVSDVAQQTRTPLTLASTLAQQMSLLMKDRGANASRTAVSRLEQICTRVVSEVAKADITFERLAEGLAIAKEPLRKRENIDLVDCVRGVVALLPARDQNRIAVRMPDERVWLNGDADRIAFVVRSIIAYLVRCRPGDDTRVEAVLARRRQAAVLTLQLNNVRDEDDVVEPRTRDALWEAFRVAREDASLGLRTVNKVIRAHGGRLAKRAPRRNSDDAIAPWVAFEVTLPLNQSGEAAHA